MLNNIKKYQASKGFTIVELLIVIVVIAILAAISIVAYNGIQNRGRLSSAQSSAASVAKKIEAYNAITNAYPVFNTTGTVTTQLNGQQESSLTGSGTTIAYTGISGTNGTTTVQVRLCGATAPASGAVATGFQVWGWDYTLATPALVNMQSGGTTTACSTSTGGN